MGVASCELSYLHQHMATRAKELHNIPTKLLTYATVPQCTRQLHNPLKHTHMHLHTHNVCAFNMSRMGNATASRCSRLGCARPSYAAACFDPVVASSDSEAAAAFWLAAASAAASAAALAAFFFAASSSASRSARPASNA